MSKGSSFSTESIHSKPLFNSQGRNNYGISVHDGSTVIFDKYEDFIHSEIDPNKATIADITTKLPDYGRGGNTTAIIVEQMIAKFENADYCKLMSTGLAAIRVSLMAFLKAGDHVLITDGIYGPVKVLITNFLSKFGVSYTFFDPLAEKDEIMAKALPNTKVIYAEIPCSRFFEVANISAIAAVAKKINAVAICDNSYSTWINFKPLDNGFDVSVTSLTKYAAGHSDMLAGSICVKKKHFASMLEAVICLGDHFPAQSASNLLRGMRTMALRMDKSIEVGKKFITYLKTKKQIAKIYHPSQSNCPGHKHFIKHVENAPSLLSIALDKEYSQPQMKKFFNGLKLFGMGYSYGGVESLAIPIPTKNTRLYSANQPVQTSSMRIYIGLEDINDLIEDFDNALKLLK